MNETGSCWNESPFGPGQTNGLLCELPSGHQGAHRAAESEWMVRDTAEPREPSDAHVRAARLAWLDARVKGKGHLDAMRSALHAAAKAGYKA